MEMLKKFFPFSFKSQGLVNFIITLIVYLVISAVLGWAIAVLAGIPIVGILCGLLGALLELYVLVGVVLAILNFLKIVK